MPTVNLLNRRNSKVAGSSNSSLASKYSVHSEREPCDALLKLLTSRWPCHNRIIPLPLVTRFSYRAKSRVIKVLVDSNNSVALTAGVFAQIEVTPVFNKVG